MGTLRTAFRALAVLAILLAGASWAQAQTRIHEVKRGETLTSIAQAYQMTANELRALNKLPNERIEVGQKLKVRDIDPVPPSLPNTATGVGNLPAQTQSGANADTARSQTPRMTRTVETPARNESPRQQQSQPPPRTQTQPSQPEPEVKVVESVHVVKAGETLFSIARQYDISVADLKKFNNILGNDVSAGQRLKVFQTVVTTGSEAVDRQIEAQTQQAVDVQQRTEQSQGEPPRQTGPATLADSLQWYTVRTGDSLPSIARDFKMSVAELREYNGLTENRVYPGDRLRVKATSTSAGQPPVPRNEPPVMIIDPPIEENRTTPPPNNPPANTQQQQAEPPVEQVQTPPDDEPFVPQGIATLPHGGRFIGHTVKRNERLAAILEAYKMDEREFYALNPSLDGRPPRAGIEVLVYEPPTNLKPNPYAVEGAGQTNATEQAYVYSESDKGKLTSSGELYNPINLTAAHPSYELGTVLYVVNPKTGRGTYVRVNDRTDQRGIQLSGAAVSALGLDMNALGIVSVSKE